jgi:hypothetical protein
MPIYTEEQRLKLFYVLRRNEIDPDEVSRDTLLFKLAEFLQAADDKETAKKVAWQMALADGRDQHDHRIAAIQMAVGVSRYLKLSEVALATFKHIVMP